MRFFELTKDTLGMKKGQSFMQTTDGMYVNATNSARLSSAMVEGNTEYFKETEAPNIWKPSQALEAFWTITPDGGTMELAWDENRFGRLWQFGNVFRDKEHADEVAQSIAVMIPTYQKKFNEYITKNPKPPKIIQQATQQATPPVNQMQVPGGFVPQTGIQVAPPPMQQPPPPPMPPQPPQAPPQRNLINDPRFNVHDPRLSPRGVGNLFTTPGNER